MSPKAKKTESSIRMKVTLAYDVPNVEKSVGLFEKGLQESMNRAAKKFGLQFSKMTVEVAEDAEP